MEHEIEGAEGVHLLYKIKRGSVGFVEDQVVQVSQVFRPTGDEIINAGYFMTFRDEALTEMGADEAGGAGDQYIHSFSVVRLASC